jgi:beta-glucosidase
MPAVSPSTQSLFNAHIHPDRNDLEAWHSGAALVQKVASVNSNTIVVVQSVGPINLETFVTSSNGTCF